MLIYYRLPGGVASFALIYYTLVMVAIFRLIPVTLTLAGIAGFVLSVGMAVDANILIFERMKEELRLGKSLPAAVEAGFNRAWNSILDSNVSSLITATILYAFGSSVIRGLRPRPDHRRPRLDVQRHRRDPDDPALGRPPGVGAEARAVRPARRRVRRPRVRRDPPADARRARVFDVIAKRRWFYIFSLIITIPGLVFILLTPFTDAGLQFTIDYTGGTKWEIRFEDASVTPDQVEAVFAEQGLEASAVSTGSGFIEIKTERPADFLEVVPSSAPSAGPSGSPVASGSPAAERLGGPERVTGAQRERQPGPERIARAERIARSERVAVRRTGRPATPRSRRRARSARSRPRSRTSSDRSPSSAA